MVLFAADHPFVNFYFFVYSCFHSNVSYSLRFCSFFSICSVLEIYGGDWFLLLSLSYFRCHLKSTISLLPDNCKKDSIYSKLVHIKSEFEKQMVPMSSRFWTVPINRIVLCCASLKLNAIDE